MRDTIDMAREAGFDVMRLHGVLPHVPEAILIANVCVTKEVNRLVALARADEREACAKEFDRRAVYVDGSPSSGWYEPEEPARIIRARGNS